MRPESEIKNTKTTGGPNCLRRVFLLRICFGHAKNKHDDRSPWMGRNSENAFSIVGRAKTNFGLPLLCWPPPHPPNFNVGRTLLVLVDPAGHRDSISPTLKLGGGGGGSWNTNYRKLIWKYHSHFFFPSMDTSGGSFLQPKNRIR